MIGAPPSLRLPLDSQAQSRAQERRGIQPAQFDPKRDNASLQPEAKCSVGAKGAIGEQDPGASGALEVQPRNRDPQLEIEWDAGRGRLYLPEEDLERFGVTAGDVMEGKLERLRELLRFETDRAEGYYREALTLAGELGMRPLTARCLLGLSGISRIRGDPTTARERLEEAVRMFRAMEMTSHLAVAERDLLDI